MHNVEKSAFRKGEYVGYGGGFVWHIRKTTSSSGNWVARPHPDNQRIASIYAFRLKDMSDKLEGLNMVKKNPKHKTAKRKFTAKQIAAQKLFAKRAKAGTLRKVKRVRKNPAKRKTVKKIARKRIRTSPLRAKRHTGIRKAAKGRKKTLTSSQRATSANINPRRPASGKFVIMGTQKTKTGYRYFYLKKNGRYDDDIRKAQRWNTRAACHLKMREALMKMPFALTSIRCVKL